MARQDYAARVDVEFQKAGVRGMSIMFSSGDGGVSGSQAPHLSTTAGGALWRDLLPCVATGRYAAPWA